MDVRRGLKFAGMAVGGLVVLVVVGFLLGVFGVPEVQSVDNEFGDVNESTTEIQTTITVDNPNPFGVSLGGLTLDYTVNMSGVPMADGQKEGLSIGTGNSTVELTTYLDNTRIPDWWYNHIDGGEQSEVVVDATASHSTFGERDFRQNQTVETNLLSSVNSSETRPINASAPVVSDPALYLNQTNGSYGQEITPEQTPIDLDFTLYNPKQYPYVVTRLGYTINMNNITVGEGETDRNTVIGPRQTQTVTAETVIQNERLDEWWVSHIRNDQVTDLYIDIYVVVKPDRGGALADTEGIRIDSEEFDYRETIETDIFGNKDNGTATDGQGQQPEDGTTDGTATETPRQGSETTTGDETQTGSEPQTPDEGSETTEDDGLLAL